MNAPDLQTLWNSPHNRPTDRQLTVLHAQLRQLLRMRHLRFLLMTAPAGIALTLLTGRLVWFIRSGGVLDITREWASLGLLFLTLATLIFLWAGQVRHLRRHRASTLSIRDSLLTLLAENRLAQIRLRVIAALQTVLLAALPLVAHQLQEAGKAGPEIRIPFLMIGPALICVILAVMAWHHFRHLRPEELRLRSLLRDQP